MGDVILTTPLLWVVLSSVG